MLECNGASPLLVRCGAPAQTAFLSRPFGNSGDFESCTMCSFLGRKCKERTLRAVAVARAYGHTTEPFLNPVHSQRANRKQKSMGPLVWTAGHWIWICPCGRDRRFHNRVRRYPCAMMCRCFAVAFETIQRCSRCAKWAACDLGQLVRRPWSHRIWARKTSSDHRTRYAASGAALAE